MANDELVNRLTEMTTIDDADELNNALDRVLTGPQQETLLEAIAADAVDVVPIAGDLTTLVRQNRAEEMGMTYPDRPAVIENALSDLPPPVDTIADIIIAQNTISHLEREKGIPVASALEEGTGNTSEAVDQLVANLLQTDDESTTAR